MNAQKQNYVEFALYIFIFIAFYLLNRYSPFICDDYYYAFIMSDGMFGDMVYTPIQTLSDIAKSQFWAYCHHNGRFVVHSIVQLFCGILGVELFVFINSLIFVLLIIGFTKCIRVYRGISYDCDILLNFFVILLGTPILGVTFLGNISFAVNYLWTSCAIIWWLYIYKININKKSKHNILLFIFSFLVASLQESFSIGIAGALGIYYLFNRNKLKGTRLYLVAGFILGSCLVVFAPANFVRFESEQGGSFDIVSLCLRTVRVALSLRVFWIMILSLVIMAFNYSKEHVLLFIKKHILLILSILINILFASVIAMNGKHQMVSIELLSTLLLIDMLSSSLLFQRTRQNAVIICLLIVTMIIYIPAFNIRKEFYDAHKVLLENAANSSDGIVLAKDYEELCCKDSNWFIEKFAKQEKYWSYNKRGLSLILSEGRDIKYIKAILPATVREIVNICVEDNKIADCVYKSASKDYYVLRINTSEVNVKRIQVYLQPGRWGKFIYRLIHKSSLSFDIEELSIGDTNNVEVGEHTYVIISSPSPIMSVQLS